MIIIFIARLVIFMVDAIVYSVACQWNGHWPKVNPEVTVQSRRLYGRAFPVFICIDLLCFIFCLWYFPGFRSIVAIWLLQPSSQVMVFIAPGVSLFEEDKGRPDRPSWEADKLEKSKTFEKILNDQRKIINGLIPLAGGRGLIRILLKVRRLIYARAPNKSDVKICKHFARRLWQLRRDSGPTFLLQYLKGCSVLLQQYVGRHKIPDPRAVGPAVSRTHAGLPRIIPRQQRYLIRRTNAKTIQFYLSIFNIYRVLDCKYKSDPLKTIRHGSGLPIDHEFIRSSEQFLPIFFFSWITKFKKLDPQSVKTWLPSLGRNWQPFLVAKATAPLRGLNLQATSVPGILEAIYAWREHFLLSIGKNPAWGGKPTIKDKLLWQSFKTWSQLVMPQMLDLLRFKAPSITEPVSSPVLSSKPLPVNTTIVDGKTIMYTKSANCNHPDSGICYLCVRNVLDTPGAQMPETTEANYVVEESPIWDMEDPLHTDWDVRGRIAVRFAQAWKIFPQMWHFGLFGWGTIFLVSLSAYGALRDRAKKRYWTLGRLIGLKEAAGKLRVIALVDIMTQWMLSPLHRLIFAILEVIPQDGTFDQEAPIHLLRAKLVDRKDKFSASYDLSAATDCLPLTIQKRVLAHLIGTTLSEAWGHLLTARQYMYKPFGLKAEFAYYGVGQPMGALSSWASLAITHHFIVQWAAWLAGWRTGWFPDYAVLGDDVVICNRSVAAQYLNILDKLGVKVGLHKSIVSNRGVMEFAKKFYSPTDVMTPIPIKELLVSEKLFPVFMNLIRKYPIKISDLVALMGYKYKTLGNLHGKYNTLPKRVKTAIITFLGPGGPGFISYEDWLSHVSLVTLKGMELDYHHIMAHILERANSLRDKASMLARQPGHSLTWLLEGTAIDPYFEQLDRKAAVTAMVMAEEDRGTFFAIKRRILDPLALEEALKAHAVWEDLGKLLEDSMKRFFSMTKSEVLSKFAELEELQERLFNIQLVDTQVRPEPDFRPDARKLYKLYNKLSTFDKASTAPAIPIESRWLDRAQLWEKMQQDPTAPVDLNFQTPFGVALKKLGIAIKFKPNKKG